MSDIIRISAHPTDPKLCLVHVPPHLANIMAPFPPARWMPQHKAYAVHQDAEPGLHATLAHAGAHTVDERHSRPVGERTLMPECTGCGQPAKAARQPNRCPTCGERWQPRYVNPDTGGGTRVRQTCNGCGRTQRGRFPHCGNCGAAMPPEEPKPHVKVPRQRLKDPMPLAETVAETAAQLEEDR